MRWRQDLQVKLRSRYRRLYTAGYSRLSYEMDQVVSWITNQSALVSILEEARLSETLPPVDEWLPSVGRQDWSWPSRTEAGRAVLVWDLIRHMGTDSEDLWDLIWSFTGESNEDDGSRGFVEHVVQPLVEYLEEQIGDGSSILYALERYVRQSEWFDRKRLYAEFSDNTQQGEMVYDRHLREFLFHEGFNMPYSQQRSPSGLSDVLADIETDDALVCELKVYDGSDRDIRHLANGVTQAIQYAHDYRKHAAHLVIVNLANRQLQLPSDGAGDAKPPYLEGPEVRVYLVQVRGLPQASASKQGKSEPLRIERRQLIGDGL